MSFTNSDAEFFRLSPFLDMLRKKLSMLPTKHRLAFGLYCCERLYPSYVLLAEKIRSDSSVIRSLLDRLWQHICDGHLDQQELEQFQEQLQELNFGEEGCCDEQDGAIDAAGAVWLTLEAWRHESAANTAKVAGNLLNRIHQRLMDEEAGSDYSLSAEEMRVLMQRIEEHQAMKAVQQQLLQIVEFLNQMPLATAADAERLRTIAREGAA